MTYVRPTARQRELLAAYVEAPTVREAAASLGLTTTGYSSGLRKIRLRTGLTIAQAIYFGQRDGWLPVREEQIAGAKDAPNRRGGVAAGV